MANPTMKVRLSQLTAGTASTLEADDLLLIERDGVSHALTGQTLLETIAGPTSQILGPWEFEDPNGVVSGIAPKLGFTTSGALWIKTDAEDGNTNVGWVKIIG